MPVGPDGSLGDLLRACQGESELKGRGDRTSGQQREADTCKQGPLLLQLHHKGHFKGVYKDFIYLIDQ